MSLKAKIKGTKKSLSTSFIGCVAKGTMIALCVSLILVLIFAFLLKFTNIPEGAIKPINQVIKGVSVFLGVFVGMKRIKELGLVTGLLIGIFHTVLAFLVFSILGGMFQLDITFLTDIVFSAIIGAICGIICVNIKKSSN